MGTIVAHLGAVGPSYLDHIITGKLSEAEMEQSAIDGVVRAPARLDRPHDGLVARYQTDPGADGVSVDHHAIALEAKSDPAILVAYVVAKKKVGSPAADIAAADQEVEVAVEIDVRPHVVLSFSHAGEVPAKAGGVADLPLGAIGSLHTRIAASLIETAFVHSRTFGVTSAFDQTGRCDHVGGVDTAVDTHALKVAVGLLPHQTKPGLLVELVVGFFKLVVPGDREVEAAVIIEVDDGPIDVAFVKRKAAFEKDILEVGRAAGALIDEKLGWIGPFSAVDILVGMGDGREKYIHPPVAIDIGARDAKPVGPHIGARSFSRLWGGAKPRRLQKVISAGQAGEAPFDGDVGELAPVVLPQDIKA